LETTWT